MGADHECRAFGVKCTYRAVLHKSATASAPALALGDHRLYAIATSSTGTTGTSPTNIIAVGAANSPVALITSPRFDGLQFAPSFSTVRFAANAQHTGALGIQRVEFWLDNTLLAADTTAPYEMDWVVGANTGYHELIARAYDTSGAFANSDQVAFELIIPPLITLSAPANVSPDTPVTLTANVTQGTYALQEVRFFVNNTLAFTDTTAPFTFDWTPTATGTFTLDATVQDTRYVERSAATQTATSAYTPIQNWRATHFGTHQNTGIAADDANPDHDSLVNLLEYALAGNPHQSSSAELPHMNNFVFEFTPNPAATDITLTPQWSPDLTQWFDTAPPAGLPARFHRLRVSRP